MELSRDYEMINKDTNGVVVFIKLGRRSDKVVKMWCTKENPDRHQGRTSFHDTIEEALEGHEFAGEWKKSDEFGRYSAY
jgi:hypothetical protein